MREKKKEMRRRIWLASAREREEGARKYVRRG